MATKVSIDQLRKADIIVSTTDAVISGAIRAGSGSDFSHTMLYTGNSYVVEAVADGVVHRPWSEASADATLAIALRRRNMTNAKKDEVVDNALAFKGRDYDAIGALGAGITKKRGSVLWNGVTINVPGLNLATKIAIANNARDSNKDDAFFCSELVARAFQLACMSLSTVEPTFMNPREVRMCANLMYVGHLIS